MKTILCILTSIGLTLSSQSQSLKIGDSLNVEFKIDKVISDTDRFCLNITYTNISSKPMKVYDQLEEGYLQDKFCNINLIIEEKIKGKFETFSRSYENTPGIEYADSNRHFDVSKSVLQSKESRTLKFNFQRLKFFYNKGDYRVKISLRINTIQDNTKAYKDSAGMSFAPLDKLFYQNTDWIYFTLNKDVIPDRRP